MDLLIDTLGPDISDIICVYTADPENIEQKYKAGYLFMQIFYDTFIGVKYKHILNFPYDEIRYYTPSREIYKIKFIFPVKCELCVGCCQDESMCWFNFNNGLARINKKIFIDPSMHIAKNLNDDLNERLSIIRKHMN